VADFAESAVVGGFKKGNPGCCATARNRAESRMLRTFGPGVRKPNGNSSGRAAMASVQPSNGYRDRQIDSPAPRPDMNHLNLNALLEENKQLRELVVQLSEIVVRNVLDRK
jgi:hypothetical protein